MIDTASVTLSADLSALIETLAQHNHDIWSINRINDGWTYGESRNDSLKQHPCLIPYHELPESEKAYDRATASENIKALVSLGYKISLV